MVADMKSGPCPMFISDFVANAPPNQRVMIDAQEFIVSTLALNTVQVGQIVGDIIAAATRRDWDYIESFPFVVRMYRGVECRPGIPLAVKKDVLAVGRCAFCGTTERLTVDHVQPYSKGGTHDRENLQCLCFPCNVRKSNKWEGVH